MTTSTHHVPADVLADYASGRVDEVSAWSVEAHLPDCPSCRDAVAAYVDTDRLARNRAIVLAGSALPGAGRLRRLLVRLGVRDDLLGLLAATPALLWSGLLAAAGALAVVVGEALVVHYTRHGPPGAGPSRAELLPFLMLGPLLVLAGVAAAFLPAFDPAHALAAAAPASGFRLLLLRGATALLAALVPVVCAAFFVPGPGWLPAALLLPCLAMCGLGLAALTVVGPVLAAAASGAGWIVLVLALGLSHHPLVVVQWNAQLGCAAVLITAAALIWTRRDRFEWGLPEWA